MRRRRKRKIYVIFAAVGLLGLSACQQISTSFKFMAAQSAYNHGKFQRAIELYKELVEINPEDPSLRWSLGISYYSSGDLLNARRQAVRLRKLGQKELARQLEQLIEQPL